MTQRKITDAGVAGLPILEGRAELLEEIMTIAPERPATKPTRPPWLAPLAAAAAIVVLVAGIWLATELGGEDKAQNPSFDDAPSDSAGSVPHSVNCSMPLQPGEKRPAEVPDALSDCEEINYYRVDREESGPEIEIEAPPVVVVPGDIHVGPWRVDRADGTTLHLSNYIDGGNEMLVWSWVTLDEPSDPFAYDAYERRGTEGVALDVPTRFTSYTKAGVEHQVALTAGIGPNGESLLLDGVNMSESAMKATTDSIGPTSIATYENWIARGMT